MKIMTTAAVMVLATTGLLMGCGDSKPAASPTSNTTAADPTAKDSDGDGIPDTMDKCPDKKEDGQGADPKDGCPNSDAPKK
jgi:hypothetical protein